MRHVVGGSSGPAALTLLGFMEDISEEYWAAAWLTDLESMLWKLVQGDRGAVGHPWPAIDEDAILLRRLSEMCHGWWAWDEARHDVVFVPLDDWRRRIEA